MVEILSKTWALFFGFALIMLGHGLQGTLLGVRSTIEGFSFISTGFIIAGYFIGYLSGSIIIPIFLNRVGHIRVFAALASLASIAILMHSLFLDPVSWFFIRILTGISLAGIYIIMESWLNDKSTNQSRGKLLSIYMIVNLAFVGLGQLLLNLSDPATFDLFILISILLSFALLPILLTITEQPNIINPKRLSLREFYTISPLGFIGALFTGLAHSVIFGYGAVYASSINLSIFEISVFMAVITTFGALSQWPYGYLSDKLDRRIILVGTTLAAAFLSLLIIGFSYLSFTLFLFFVGIYSCASVPMYSLAVAHINDYLRSDEIIAATSTFSILVGVGAIIGPIIVSSIMTVIGSNGFFIYLFVVHILLGLFGLYRMSKRTKSSDIESQYVPLPRNITPAGMELTPVTEQNEE